MRFYLIFLIVLFGGYAHGQKPTIEKISKHNIDSLRNVHVDTLVHYQSYCGECFISDNKKRPCYVASGYTLIENIIIYKQRGKFYSLEFDCDNIPLKKQLDSCKSIAYFLAILPTLNARDKAIKAIYKKGRFLGPTRSDGGFVVASIYFNTRKQSVSMSEGEKTDLYEVYKKYFWIDKQIKLLGLISKDIAAIKK